MDSGQHLIISATGKQVPESCRDICKGAYISVGTDGLGELLEVTDV